MKLCQENLKHKFSHSFGAPITKVIQTGELSFLTNWRPHL